MLPTILLTGATGLVGRYLLRKFMSMNYEVAAIVRAKSPSIASQNDSGKRELARKRIDQELMPFEQFINLRRPRAVPWDLSDSTQLMDDEDLSWLKKRRIILVHCAASIRFLQDKASGEPYRTNVDGTKNLLHLCQQLDVEGIHFVSTAYVGQHRSRASVLEEPVSDGAIGNNDYETSKQRAEKLVYSFGELSKVFVHRPSIVVGDSQTGFTSTFHGFYTPLQIGWNFARQFGFSDEAGSWFRSQLGLGPNDSKNLVPVDWVAEAISEVVDQQANDQLEDSHPTVPSVLHFTNPLPVSCQDIQAAIVTAIQQCIELREPSYNLASETDSTHDNLPSPQQFRAQMAAYESYFQSDPIFDTTRSSAVTLRLPCPLVNRELLTKLATWAIDSNFGWPKSDIGNLPNQDVCRLVLGASGSRVSEARVAAQTATNSAASFTTGTTIQLDLLGPGSPERLWLENDGSQWSLCSPSSSPEFKWQLSLQALAACISQTSDTNRMIASGRWSIEGKSTDRGIAIAYDWINFLLKRSNVGRSGT